MKRSTILTGVLAVVVLVAARQSSVAATILGTFDVSPSLGQVAVNPNGDLVYLSNSMGGTGLIRINASNPAAMTSQSLPNGGGIAVDVVSGRYATTNGVWGSTLFVYNPDDSLYDSQSLTGIGGELAAGNGTFGVSTQGNDSFEIYTEASKTITWLRHDVVGSSVTCNKATGRYYWNVGTNGVYPDVFQESPPAYLHTLSGVAVVSANGVTNRLYGCSNTGSFYELNGSTETIEHTFPITIGTYVATDTALDCEFVTASGSSEIVAYDGTGSTQLGAFTLPDGYSPVFGAVADGDDRLYVIGHKTGVTNNRLFVIDAASAVPEPSTILLLGIGAIVGLLACRWRPCHTTV
jgi:hypothetical protein